MEDKTNVVKLQGVEALDSATGDTRPRVPTSLNVSKDYKHMSIDFETEDLIKSVGTSSSGKSLNAAFELNQDVEIRVGDDLRTIRLSAMFGAFSLSVKQLGKRPFVQTQAATKS